MRFVAGLIAVVVMSSAPAVAADSPLDVVDAGAAGELEWRPCEGGECAELTVPRDYKKPGGATIDVALFRVPAAQPAARIGSLLTNFGGPGFSGVTDLRNLIGAFPQELRDRFDLVGFDSRGTGNTIPVDCTDSLEPLLDLDYSPDSRAERNALATAGRDFADACEDRSGGVLPYIGSLNTVRDMDRIRAALGDEGLSYVGISYGTYLGALYAELFPERVRALVLDGAVDPSLSTVEMAEGQAVGFERALDTFLGSCAADSACPFHNDGNPGAAFDELLASVESAPIAALDGRSLGPNEFQLAVTLPLYQGERAYTELGSALMAAANGDSGGLFRLYDNLTERNPDGSYTNSYEAYFSIICSDRPPIRARAYRRLENRFADAAPRMGLPLLYEYRMCAEWPVAPAHSPKVDAKGANPILVIAATGDPATPYANGEALAQQLDSGVLLTVEDDAHGSFFTVTCANEPGVRYLVDLQVPESGAPCSN